MLDAIDKASACLVGCGLGTAPYATKLVDAVLENAHGTVVLDADALNILAKTPEKLLVPQAPVIITPHPGEMCRLNGRTMAELRADRLQTARVFAQTYRVITVLKGAGTIIAAPSGETRVNTTGNPGMAKGGSGDVLAGITGALCAVRRVTFAPKRFRSMVCCRQTSSKNCRRSFCRSRANKSCAFCTEHTTL